MNKEAKTQGKMIDRFYKKFGARKSLISKSRIPEHMTLYLNEIEQFILNEQQTQLQRVIEVIGDKKCLYGNDCGDCIDCEQSELKADLKTKISQMGEEL